MQQALIVLRRALISAQNELGRITTDTEAEINAGKAAQELLDSARSTVDELEQAIKKLAHEGEEAPGGRLA